MNLNSSSLEKQYKNKLSDFREWEQEVDVEALVYPENCGENLSLDETSLHNGDLYTILTNKAAAGRKGAIVALVKGTDKKTVLAALRKIPVKIRFAVKEVTVDLDKGMDRIATEAFPRAELIADRFHVQKLVHGAVQEVRLVYRRQAIDEENDLRLQAKEQGIRFHPERYANGDTKKQLLARSRYLLFKPMSKWSDSQRKRAAILFEHFPKIKQAYDLSMELRDVFEARISEQMAAPHLTDWLKKVKQSKIDPLISTSNTIKVEYWKILRYFRSRSTNAAAESFNAKLKGFRALLRGIRDIKFFLYRVQKLYA